MEKKYIIFTLISLFVIAVFFPYFIFDRGKEGWVISFWGVVGTNFSILGIIYAGIQINGLKLESKIIKDVSLETKEKINQINQYADIATAIKLIQEIQGYARMHKHEVGVMRLQELKIIITQMKLINLVLQRPFDRDATIFKLNQLINGMEKDISSKTKSTQPATVNASLEKILDALVEIQQQTLERN